MARKDNRREPDALAKQPALPSGRPPTSHDVARLAGVSQATVSYVLNDQPNSRVGDETRARVLAAADELGYTAHAMARSLRAGQSNIILLPQLLLPTGPMITRFYEELAARLGALGYTFITHLDPSARGVEAVRIWASLRPVGVLVEAARVSRRSIELLRIAGTRAVIATAEAPSQLAPTLVNNDSDVGACAAEYLIASGRRSLAVIVPREAGLLRLGLERLSGAERVALDRHAMGARPSGVFAYNDDYALLLMGALRDAGIAIPREIGLVGADNLPFCAMLRPRLTSVDKPDLAGVDKAAEAFHALIQGTATELPPIQLLQPRIVVRESA